MGEGDEMIFVDDETKPAIIGTGMEDYFLGSWNFGGRENAQQFSHRYYGAPLIALADNYYSCCYWYQVTPYTDFPALPPVAERIPKPRPV